MIIYPAISWPPSHSWPVFLVGLLGAAWLYLAVAVRLRPPRAANLAVV